MDAPSNRMEQPEKISKGVFDPLTFRAVWNNSLEEAAKMSIFAPRTQQGKPGNLLTEPNLAENVQSNDPNISKVCRARRVESGQFRSLFSVVYLPIDNH